VGKQAQNLIQRFKAFNNELKAFVRSCSDQDWRTLCPDEGWTVGVVAHHVAARHYDWLRMAELIAAGEEAADVSLPGVNLANAKHARDNADCTQQQVLGILDANGAEIISFLSSQDDADLERATYFSLMQGDISAAQVIEWLIIHMGSEHLQSMRAANGSGP
jgi:hypothetical protein